MKLLPHRRTRNTELTSRMTATAESGMRAVLRLLLTRRLGSARAIQRPVLGCRALWQSHDWFCSFVCRTSLLLSSESCRAFASMIVVRQALQSPYISQCLDSHQHQHCSVDGCTWCLGLQPETLCCLASLLRSFVSEDFLPYIDNSTKLR